jgi:hypothetical protein
MSVRSWLHGLFGGRATMHVEGAGEGQSDGDAVRLHGALLMTQRIADPLQRVAGFQQVYCCTRCKDYFVLGWQPASAKAPERAQVVSVGMLPPATTDLDALQVFCPVCRTRFDEYGPVLDAESEPPRMTVRSTFSIRFPTSKPGHDEATWIRAHGQAYDVAIVTSGEFPEGVDRAEWLGTFMESELASLGAIEVSSTFLVVSGVQVDEVSDEAPAVFALLCELGIANARDAAPILTSPIREDLSPRRQRMLCSILKTLAWLPRFSPVARLARASRAAA